MLKRLAIGSLTRELNEFSESKRRQEQSEEPKKGVAKWQIVELGCFGLDCGLDPCFRTNPFKADTKRKNATGNSWCRMGNLRGHACRAPWWKSRKATTETCVHILRAIRGDYQRPHTPHPPTHTHTHIEYNGSSLAWLLFLGSLQG